MSQSHRYLSDNFPKILTLPDFKGRTALHYAAVAESGSGSGYYKIVSNAVGADKGFIQSVNLQLKSWNFTGGHQPVGKLCAVVSPNWYKSLICWMNKPGIKFGMGMFES